MHNLSPPILAYDKFYLSNEYLALLSKLYMKIYRGSYKSVKTIGTNAMSLCEHIELIAKSNSQSIHRTVHINICI